MSGTSTLFGHRSTAAFGNVPFSVVVGLDGAPQGTVLEYSTWVEFPD